MVEPKMLSHRIETGQRVANDIRKRASLGRTNSSPSKVNKLLERGTRESSSNRDSGSEQETL